MPQMWGDVTLVYIHVGGVLLGDAPRILLAGIQQLLVPGAVAQGSGVPSLGEAPPVPVRGRTPPPRPSQGF